MGKRLKRNPGAELNLTARRRGFSDDAELRRIYETARRPEVGMIESVEKLRSELNLRLFRDIELTSHGQIERLHSGADDRIPPHISEGKSRWRGEGRRIKPAVRGTRAIIEDCPPRIIGPNGIFAEQGSGVRRVAEDRDSERESALNLIDGRKEPSLSNRRQNSGASHAGKIEDRAQ